MPRRIKKRYAPISLYFIILLIAIPIGAAYYYYITNSGVIEYPPQKVFKMWYGFGWENPNIGYAESIDGKTWTKYSGNPIVSGGNCPSVFKDGSTYYMFQSGPPNWGSAIKRLHSYDGINWINDGDVLSKGSVGQWDGYWVANSFVWKEGPNDWRMLYDGYDRISWWKVGYATSSNGLNWVKSPNNPVISTYGGGAGHLQKVGSEYWFWTWGQDWGCGLPTDGYRQKSVNLINWIPTPFGSAFPRATADEGVGNSVGQVADLNLVEYNNQVYLYYAASSDGSQRGGNMQIKLAIADMPFSSLIKTSENFGGGNVFVRYGSVLVGDALGEEISLHEPTVLYDVNPQILG